jgi:radical SAM protein with 4Fe4S-binding SPASM domain
MNFNKSQISDFLNFFSKLSLRKALNLYRLVFSYYFSKYTGSLFQSGMPMSVSIEPTTSCNLRCPECPSGLKAFSRPTGNLDQDFFRKTIDELHKDLMYLIFYFQGEPYLNPDFLEMVSYASEKKIYTITSTNAHFLNDENARKTVESGLDRLIISLDGTTQETYESYRRGGKLEKVIEGTRNILKWKKQLQSSKPYVIFQFLVVKPNEHQIDEVKKLAKEIGVDKVLFKSAQIYDYQNGNELIPAIEKYSRYSKLADGRYAIKSQMANSCWKMWHSDVITWDGKVVPCCFDKDAKFVLGELKKNSFHEIWQNPEYQKFRSEILIGRDKIDMCKNCTEGTRVWL